MKRLTLTLLTLVAMVAASAQPTLFLIGDSTCANKKLDKENPERGWGQLFQALVCAPLKVENHAVNGRSTKSFRAEGRWQVVCDRIQEGDYVFIQFGHNDQKSNDSTRYSTPEQYAENLVRYVREARERGARPILLTPIVRRKWENGQLIDTHTPYSEAMRRVAHLEQVPWIDMEALTRQWVQELGDKASKGCYMWVEAGTSPLYPDGREDDTHLNVRGAHQVARMVARELMTLAPELAPNLRFPDLVVAQDGSGDFFTLQEAVLALPDFSRDTTRLLLRAGTYHEKVSIPASKRRVKFEGEGADRTKITYDAYSSERDRFGRERGTSGSSTLYFGGDGWLVEGITFENSAGEVGQAVAVQCIGDRIWFRNCRFLGWQDTLYLYGVGNRDGEEVEHNSAYRFEKCYIEGSTDFIFGSAEALFIGCEIHSKRDSYITAASTCRGQERGFRFVGCRLTAAEGVTKCFLGRPWRSYAQTTFEECWLGEHIAPEGWHNWSKLEAERTVRYREIGSTGPGAAPEERVAWAETLHGRSYEKWCRAREKAAPGVE